MSQVNNSPLNSPASTPPATGATSTHLPPFGFWRTIAALAVCKTLVLLWIVADRVIHLTTGTDIILDATPVDPRSLFRGDYVIVSTPIHTIPRAKLAPADTNPSRDVFAVVERAAGASTWTLVSAHRTRPPSRSGEVVIKGRLTGGPADSATVFIEYGIEAYFVPEGKGRAIEDAIGTGRVAVRLAVDGNGTPAIKELQIDGKPVYAEPLF